MLWENCFVGLFWYIINCIGPLWYYRVLVATVVLLRSLAAVITNNGQGAKTAACGQINVLMVGLKISYQLVSLLWCQHLYSVKISQRLLNRRPGGTQGSDLSHCWLIKSPSPRAGGAWSYSHQARVSICITCGASCRSHEHHEQHFYEILNSRLWEFVCLIVRLTD